MAKKDKAVKTNKNNKSAKKAKGNGAEKIAAPVLQETTARAAATKGKDKKIFVRHVGNNHPVFGVFVTGEGYVGGDAAFVKNKASQGTPIGVYVGNRPDVVIGMKENDVVTTRTLTPKEALILGETLIKASGYARKNKKVSKVLQNATATSKTKETQEA